MPPRRKPRHAGTAARSINAVRWLTGAALGVCSLASCSGRTAPIPPGPTKLGDPSHHIDLPAVSANPENKRAQARAQGALAPRPSERLPAPRVAVRALKDALSGLSANHAATSAPPARLGALVHALDLVDRGQASLSVREFCTGSGGLTRWLGEQTSSDAVEAVRKARLGVCAQANSYQRNLAAGPAMAGVEADEYGGLLWADPPVARLGPNGNGCILPMATVPSLSGADAYELASYMLPGSSAAIVEEGMKIGAKVLCDPYEKPTPNDPCKQQASDCPTKYDYGVQATLSYDSVVVPFLTVSRDAFTHVREIYHELPSNAFDAGRNGKTITITYQPVLRECKPLILPAPPGGLSFRCTTSDLGAPQTMTLTTVPLGSMCRLTYDANEFTINDRIDVSPEYEWSGARVTALDGAGVQSNPSFKSAFYAWARTPKLIPLVPFVVSSMPDLNLVHDGDWFAIHSDDDLKGGSVHSLWTQPFFGFNKTDKGPGHLVTTADFIKAEGTNVMSGLLFPHIVTPNPQNGLKPYSYTCQPPRIVRDFVAFCSWDDDVKYTDRGPDSLYLLPFKGRSSVVQGNNGDYSHMGNTDEQYAYDFTTKFMDNDNAYAARSGVVTSVAGNFDGNGTAVEPCEMDDPSNPGQMKPNSGCNANRVFVVHQDGTEARYFHFKHHAPVVAEGQVVHRGQILGRSGNTGKSFIQHIHFDVQAAGPDGSGPVGYSPGALTSSIPATFDEGDYPCDRPKVVELVDSTLTPGYSTTYNFLTNSDYRNAMPTKRLSTEVPPLPKSCPTLTNNTCGGCAVLPALPGWSCGNGLSQFVCSGPDAVVCNGGGPNACGGWKTLQHPPGPKCPGKLQDKCYTCTSINMTSCKPCP